LYKANLQSTYALGVSAQVWLYVPPNAQTREVVAHTTNMLRLGQIRGGEADGLYTYFTGLKEGSTTPFWSNATAGFGPQHGGA
ncbi:hypothetical protein, partial [Klebsiella pneumoniae]|uniref:hypothetical protein n=1 Tax=Klebsiella pneumoniae TaxID=573 RepID=UPI003013BA3A